MFFKYLRMSNASFGELLQLLEPYLKKRSHRALPPDQITDRFKVIYVIFIYKIKI